MHTLTFQQTHTQMTQTNLPRISARKAPAVDLALRRAAALLLSADGDASAAPQEACSTLLPRHVTYSALTAGVSDDERDAARLVAARLCVPRDMGAPAAAALRASLGSVALAP